MEFLFFDLNALNVNESDTWADARLADVMRDLEAL
jgi:hypothetical protein